MLRTIHLNVEFGFYAEEIQKVRPDWMLAAKLVCGKSFIPEP